MPLDMNPQIRAQWCAALRSGDYQQAKETLRTDPDNEGHATYCCLGVLTDLYIKSGHSERVTAPDYEPEEDGPDPWTVSVWEEPNNILTREVKAWAGLPECDPTLKVTDGMARRASYLNDEGCTFAEIADLIDGGAS